MSEVDLICFTEAAAQHVKTILARHPKGSFFRLAMKKAGCSGYMYVPSVVEAPEKNDIEWHASHGITVLIDAAWKNVFSGTVVELVQEQLGQQRLVFQNPNVEDDCGCGESVKFRDDVSLEEIPK